MILVVKPGLLTTVQDAGRWGFQHQGIPVAGPMDPWAHARANRLVGNDPRAATLEVTLGGPRLRFQSSAVVALSGGTFAGRAGQRPCVSEMAFDVAAGDELDMGWCVRGARAYVAVRGGIDVPLLFGSRATHVSSGIGGLHGRKLEAGDRLAIAQMATGPVGPPWSAATPAPTAANPAIVRIVAGPDQDPDNRWIEGLLSAPYEVSPESDRMGYRLLGPSIAMPPADRLSSPTPMGTVQVPAGGAPIVLMADRQTTGGYARVATAISADFDVLGQLRPGDRLTFVSCSHAEALAALRQRVEAGA